MKTTFIERLKLGIHSIFNSPSIDGFLKRIGLSANEAANSILLFGLSFAIGFLFKKYFKFVLGCCFAVGVVGFVLHSNNIIIIDWPAFKSFVGFDPRNADMNFIFVFLVQLVKAHVVATLSMLVGFVLGYKLG